MEDFLIDCVKEKYDTMNEQDNYFELYNELLEKHNTLIKICKIAMHDVRSPLRFLGDVGESLDFEKLNQPDSLDRKHLELLIETSRNLYFFATNVLDWFINNKLEISLDKETLALPDIIKGIVLVYDKSMKAKNNILITEYDENILVNSNKEISSIIIRNALDNANKYTANGTIRIKVKKEKDEVWVSIEDNGKGFDHKKLLQNLSDNNPSISQHIGFRIINDLAKQMGLKYELESEKGVGTNFVLKYPA